MNVRKRGEREEKMKKQTLTLLLIVSIVIVIVMAASYEGWRGQPSEPERKEAEEYFEIFDAGVDWGELRENDSVLIIYQLHFSLKAVGGNATYVTVNHKGYYLAEPVDLGNMTTGEVRWGQLTIPEPGYLVELTDEGFPIEIPVFCEEAEGNITVYL